MNHIRLSTATAIVAICCLGAPLHGQSISDASTPSLEERRLVLEEQLEDYRQDLEAAQRDYESAERELPKAKAAIDRAIADGRTGAGELMLWTQTNDRRGQAQIRMSQLQSRIRAAEAEIRQLEVAARQTRQPASPDSGAAKREDATAKADDPIEQEFAKLQGSWRGMYYGLKIEGRKVRIYWATDDNKTESADARMELDPAKGHLDFHLDNGQVVRQLYKWCDPQDGKPSFLLQRHPFKPEPRPTGLKMLWEADPGEIDIFQRIPN